jgi:pimeloyl-ACP methyl ester carboxylesterase
VSPQSLQDLKAGLADCRVVGLPGCGHLAFATQPARVAAEVKDFLSQHA